MSDKSSYTENLPLWTKNSIRISVSINCLNLGKQKSKVITNTAIHNDKCLSKIPNGREDYYNIMVAPQNSQV